jgi:hypothetical protein
MLRIACLYALLLPLSALCSTNGVSVLDMTSNVWGTSSREYRAAVFSALSEMRQQVACGDAMRGWFTNMVAYSCPDITFETWTGEKRFMIGTGASIPEIASSSECWLSVANYYGTLKGLRESLSEDTTRAARFAFLTNEDSTAYYAALADEKRRCSKCRAVENAIPGISNIVLSSFPSVILPRLTDAERQEMVSNITERAGLTEAEASLLEAYYGDIGNSGFN